MELLRAKRRKWVWTSKQLERASRVMEHANKLRQFWPLTLRQLFYQGVSAGDFENNSTSYKILSKLTSEMRFDGQMPWECLEDRSRHLSDKAGVEDMGEFIRQELDTLFENYNRCRVQGQERYVEVWIEKDALRKIFEYVTYPFCVRCLTCRGYLSVSFIKNVAERAAAAIKVGQKPTILYFGDFDPGGVQMLEASAQTISDRFGLDIDYRRIAINPDQIQGLPRSVDGAKLSDSRAKGFIKRFGNVCVELDAVHPEKLQMMAETALREVLDMDLFFEQQDIETEERERLELIKENVKEYALDYASTVSFYG